MFDLREVALAALLHDVGKLLQRGSGMPRAATHADRHHGRAKAGQSVSEAEHPSTLVVYEADNIASSLRRDEPGEAGFDSEAPLNSVFNFIGQGSTQLHSHRLGKYGGGNVGSYLPAGGTEAGPHAYRKLKDEMVSAFEKLGELDASTNVNSVMNVLERYGSYVRSSTSRTDTGDISLFDHSRVTAAIAVCIAAHLNETGADPTLSEIEDRSAPRFHFVRGDLSGVQKFIYTITSKGALRMLRARSFFLELLAEHAVAEILRRSCVPRTNVIFVGGGGFQLLLPNTEKSRETVEMVGKNLNDTFEKSFGHDLYLALAMKPCGASGIIGDGLSLRFNHEEFCDGLYIHRKTLVFAVFAGSGGLFEDRIALRPAREAAFGPPRRAPAGFRRLRGRAQNSGKSAKTALQTRTGVRQPRS